MEPNLFEHPLRVVEPTSRKLPPMETFDEAQALDRAQHTCFYSAAFVLQAWISEQLAQAEQQFAEVHPPELRLFQQGHAWRRFRQIFPLHLKISKVFELVMDYASCEDPLARHLVNAAFPLSIEHELTGDFVGRRLRHTPENIRRFPAIANATLKRLSEWLEAGIHAKMLVHWHLAPDFFTLDSRRRELRALAINHKNLDELSEASKLHCLHHLASAAAEYGKCPEWDAYHDGHAPLPQPPPWPNQNLDLALVKLWPLFQRYHWSGADFHAVLIAALPPPDLAPVPSPAALSIYCSHVVSLSSRRLLVETLQRPEPRALNIARRLCQP